MAGGLNATGLPNTGDYNLGRGTVYVATLSSGIPDVNGWRDLGNCPEFNVSVETETLEHQSSRAGLATIDKEVVTSQKVNLSFQLDELNFQNMALFLSGAAASEPDVNPAVAGVTNIVITSAVVLGRWYDLHQLANRLGTRIMDIDSANLSLRGDPDASGAGPTALVEDTDYTVDEKNGRVFFLTTATNIADGDDVDFTLAADAGALNYDEVRGLTQTNVTVAVKFISENPANNDEETEYQFHQVNLKPEGDFPLIGDDWTTMGFQGVAEQNLLADANSPYVTIRRHANS